jgi:hypothetical protein
VWSRIFQNFTEGRVLTEEFENGEEGRIRYGNGLFGGAWIHPSMPCIRQTEWFGVRRTADIKVHLPVFLNVTHGVMKMYCAKTDSYVDGAKKFYMS